jgi:hypothetical protein
VLFLFLIFLVLFLSVSVLLWASTRFLQGLFYSEPADHLEWRAPAAAGVITVFLMIWCFLDYASLTGRTLVLPYDTIFRFAPTEVVYVDHLWSVKHGEEVLYNRRGDSFLDARGDVWRRADTQSIVEAIVIEDSGGKKSRFKPELTRDGKFSSSQSFPPYFEEGGRRSMEVLGRVSVFHRGLFIANILLNALHVALWFGCFWYLLHYQWPHALGLALAVWAAMSFAVLPPLLGETVRAKYPPPAEERTFHLSSPLANVGAAPQDDPRLGLQTTPPPSIFSTDGVSHEYRHTQQGPVEDRGRDLQAVRADRRRQETAQGKSNAQAVPRPAQRKEPLQGRDALSGFCLAEA